MTVLDSFYLLFKTDAKQAQSDISALDKQIADLAAKGSKRNEAEVKQLKELRKQRAEITRDLKDQTKEVDNLGNSFVKTIEAAASAGTALFAFTAIKSGIQNVTDFNSALRVTAGILGQNGPALAAFASAAEHAGGTKEGALSTYNSLFQFYAARGLKTADPDKLLSQLRKDLAKQHTPARKALLLQRLGISDPGIISLAESSDVDFKKSLAQGQDTALTAGQQQKLRDLKQAEVDATQQVDHWFGVLGTELSDIIIPTLRKFGDLLHTISSVPGGSTALGVGGTVATGWIGGKLLKGAARWLGIGGAAVAETAGGIGLGSIAAVAAAAATIVYGSSAIGKLIGGKSEGTPAKRNAPTDQSAIDFWQSQGYSRDQAAAWAAQEQSESSGNPGAYNRGHYGLYQWSEARRQNILTGLGIDVATAGADDQRKAAAWEADQMGISGRVKATGSATAASNILTREFEIPASGAALNAEATKRAVLAGKLALDSPGIGSTGGGGDGKTLSVKTGDINIHTSATDSSGIAAGVGSALQRQLALAVSAWDDGVSA